MRGNLIYRLTAAGLRVVIAVLGLRIDIRGAHNVPARGGAVLAANHIGYLDFALLGLVGRERRRWVRFLAKSGVFEPPLVGWAMRAMRHVPVDREQGAGAVRQAERLLAAGEVVGVYPEATISRSFLIKPLAAGAAAMSIATQVPLVPIVMFGAHRVLTVDGQRGWRLGIPVLVRVGEPLHPAADADPETVSAELRRRLQVLLHEALEDYPREGAEDAWWLPEEWGGGAPPPALAARLDEEGLARVAERRARRRKR